MAEGGCKTNFPNKAREYRILGISLARNGLLIESASSRRTPVDEVLTSNQLMDQIEPEYCEWSRLDSAGYPTDRPIKHLVQTSSYWTN
jgi:hypothetical protein